MYLKKLLACVGFSLALAFTFSCSDDNSPNRSGPSENIDNPAACSGTLPKGNSPVEAYGKLLAKGNMLFGSKTGCVPVQVRGVSLGWSNTDWESAPFFNSTTVNAMVNDWKAEIVRVPLGSSEYGGYDSDPANNKNRVLTAIDAAIAKNVYVVIDWHSHKAENEVSAAKAFFKEMAEKYGNNDHVIFEIYNEPLDNVSWETIKKYAEEIIPVIRQYSNNLILVGTRTWSRRLDDVIGKELADNNVGYVLHFYSENLYLDRPVEGSKDPSSPTFRQVITQAMNAGLLVFISEYGTTNSDGGNPANGNLYSHNATYTDEWMAFMDERKLSSCAWHVNNKNEGSAFFVPSFSPASGDYNNENAMTASGKYIYNKLRAYSQKLRRGESKFSRLPFPTRESGGIGRRTRLRT